MRIPGFKSGIAPLLLLCGISSASLAAPQTPQPSLEDRLSQIQISPQKTQLAAEAGKRTASFCFNCHGTEGHSTHPETPNLAAQNAAYLLVQMQKFVDGRRKYPFMEGLLKELTDEEKVNIAVYFSTIPAKKNPPGDPAQISRGKQIFSQICHVCHGDKGLGNEQIARIASQQTPYLIKSLTLYRSSSGERKDPIMSKVASQLTDADIKAVAAYVSSL